MTTLDVNHMDNDEDILYNTHQFIVTGLLFMQKYCNTLIINPYAHKLNRYNTKQKTLNTQPGYNGIE